MIVAVLLSGSALAFRSGVTGTVLVWLAFMAAGAGIYSAESLRENAPNRLRVLYDSGAIASGSIVDVEGTLTAAAEESLNGRFVTVRAERLR